MKPSIFDDDYWKNRPYERFIATDEHIRRNQEGNRRQREREVRAAQENNSTSSNEPDTQDKDKG